MIVALAPFDREFAARQRHRHLALGALQPRRGDRGRAGGRAAGLGQAGAALPGADDDVLARDDMRQRDVGALGKDRMVFQQRPEAFADRRRSTSSTQKIACGLPMFTTEGECSTGLSIGPICNSMARVSRNSSASGISFQAKRGLPMSTVNSAVVALPAIEQAGAWSRRSARSCRSRLRHDVGDAAHAVAAGAGFRAVIVVDADEGVGAGRARRIKRHQLVVRRAVRPRRRRAPRPARSCRRARADRRRRSRCRCRSS